MVSELTRQPEYFVEKLRALHLAMRDDIRRQMARSSTAELSAVTDQRDGDTIYHIDETGEAVLLDFCDRWSREIPFDLVSEGIPGDGAMAFPRGADRARAEFRMIVDPIDGTRGIMYDKRSAWILSGVAPNKEDETTLADIEVAMQTEIPTTKQHLADMLYAVRGQGAGGERRNVLTGDVSQLPVVPTRERTVRHGFAMISKFFLGAKQLLAEMEERMFGQAVGASCDGNPLVFDDEYISTGGQLHELAVGHDRFNADLRPLVHAASGLTGAAARLCCHPYDLASELVAREAGVIVTDENGDPLRAPLDVSCDCCWIGYANEGIRGELEPTLLRLLDELKGKE